MNCAHQMCPPHQQYVHRMVISQFYVIQIQLIN